ncbi:MAG TPA: ferritin-like domain-containing protein [Acidocella sp.]|jgi:ferritin-like metal-binding protein YciE|nr:ferritin-like domain-containing protein [Acidocella sp.]
MSGAEDKVRDFYVSGLRNAHAMETQAVQLLSRQLERLKNYPAVEEQIRRHLAETESQRTRLEEVLTELNESYSSLKDTAMGLIGNIAALGHTPAPDEILKNSFANLAFEHYEIAAYKSLITIADAVGHAGGLASARASLQEEEAMARWIDEHISDTTLQFLGRKQAGLKADR